MLDFQEKAITDIFQEKFGSRITHLAAAGSIVNGRASPSSDLDLLLVLDSRNNDDIQKCRTIINELSIYKIDLSLKYIDELPTKPELFQDGQRTALSLTYICSAHFMVGTNAVFKDMLDRLSPYEFRRSILHAVAEYVMCMESKYFTSQESDSGTTQEQCFKYLTRIIIDTQLFFAPSDMSPYKQLTRPMMLELGKKDKHTSQYLLNISDNSTSEELIHAMHQIHSYLVKSLE